MTAELERLRRAIVAAAVVAVIEEGDLTVDLIEAVEDYRRYLANHPLEEETP